MEKFCPECMRTYEDESTTHCEDDKVRLLIVQDEPDLLGQVLMDRYRIEEILGQGGMGTVYLAFQESMGRKVAVKVLRSRYARNKVAIKRFHREAKASSLLTHPNTITVYDSGQTDDGQLFLVMERLSGHALCEILEAERRLAPARAIRILAQVCDSLSEAHAQGIVHRDLKAENIFIDQKPGNPDHVKVLDFGIAKMAEEEVTQATATGMICGTPSYMSPEQAMGRDLTGAADIYSIGILLYEMIVGTRPYVGESPMEVMLKQINDPVPQLPPGIGGDLSGPLNTILKRVLAKRQGDRPSDCQQLKMEFMALIGQDVPTDPIGAVQGIDLGPSDGRGVSGLEGTGLSHPVGSSTFTGSIHRLNRALWGTALGLVLVIGVVVAGVIDTTAVEEVGTPEASGVAEEEAVSVEEPVEVPSRPVFGPATPLPQDGREATDVVVNLLSTPSGARITGQDGRELGTTPWDLEGRASADRKFILTLAGYQDAPVTVGSDTTGRVMVMMVRKPAKKTRAPSAKKGASSPASHPKKAQPDKKSKTNAPFGTF